MKKPVRTHQLSQVDTPAMGDSVTLVMPVYNEAASVPVIMPEVVDYCKSRNWHLIVVNDGSGDRTKELLAAYDSCKHVTILHHKVNRGYGGAIKTGIAHAQTAFIATMDADGQHQLADVERLYDACLREDADMVVGNRGPQTSSLYREVGKGIIRRVISLLMHIPIHDVNSGMKLYRTPLAQRYAPVCPDSMAFSDIMTLMFLSEHHLVRELSITVRPRLAGDSTITVQTAFETLVEILNIITLFNPMRIFLPAAFVFGLAGVLWGLPIVLGGRGVSVGAMLAITTGILCFFLGLIAEQLSAVRKGKTYSFQSVDQQGTKFASHPAKQTIQTPQGLATPAASEESEHRRYQ